MAHDPQIVRDGLRRWRTICNCKSSSDFYQDRQQAEDWKIKHLILAERAMVHLRSRSPSIKDQFDYYTKMAGSTENSPEDRRLWQQLADGLRGRLPRPGNDDPLPFEVKYTPRRTSRDRP